MQSPFLPHSLTTAANAIAKAAAQEFGFPDADVRTLQAIAAHRDITQIEIAKTAGMTPTEVSRAVSRLVSGAHVAGTPNPYDKRGQLLRLTAKGEQAVSEIAGKSARFERKLLGAFTPSEVVAFQAALEKLQAAVSTRFAGTTWRRTSPRPRRQS